MENAFIEGGYTAFGLLNSDEKHLFEKVLAPLVGAKHVPLAVATQIVNGTN